MRRLTMAMLLPLTALAVPLTAQDRLAPESTGQESVQFAVTGALMLEGPTALPMAMLARLSGEKALHRFTLEQRGGPNAALEAQFVFTSIEAFRAWYAGDQTRTLLNDLNKAVGGNLLTSVAVERMRRPLPSPIEH